MWCFVRSRGTHCPSCTIVEIHTLILDVCVCLKDDVVLKVLCIRSFSSDLVIINIAIVNNAKLKTKQKTQCL